MTHTPRIDAITAVGCGCLAKLSDGAILLDYCPMHEAAKDMLAALKEWVEWTGGEHLDSWGIQLLHRSEDTIKQAEVTHD